MVVAVQGGHKLLAPTQSRRSSGDRAAGGGSRINKEAEKGRRWTMDQEQGRLYRFNKFTAFLVIIFLDITTTAHIRNLGIPTLEKAF